MTELKVCATQLFQYRIKDRIRLCTVIVGKRKGYLCLKLVIVMITLQAIIFQYMHFHPIGNFDESGIH